MATFVTAYLVVGLVLVLYVGRMGVRQRRLQQTLDLLQERMRQADEACQSPAKAA